MKWFRFHPLTCAAITVAIVVLACLNSRCHEFLGPGTTSIVLFGHGWPVHFQEGPVPGSGFEGMPRTPWGLHALAKPSLFGAVFDVLVALAVLTLVSVASEIAIHSVSLQIDNYYTIASFVIVLTLVAGSVSLLLANAWSYASVAFAVVLGAILVTGLILSKGYE